MRKIRTGIIGLGCRGEALLKTVLACEEAQVVSLCDKYPDRVKKGLKYIEEKQGVKAVGYEDYKQLLADERVEVVIIASSWEMHIRMGIESLYAGKITALEVGGAYDVEECWALVHAYEQTKTPLMFMENCCFDEFELLTTSLVRAGKLGEIVHCRGAYRHDLRAEICGGNVNRHYRLENYIKRNCENYPTHELGPIAKILDINRGNKMLSLVSIASKAVGLESFVKTTKNPDKTLLNTKFRQGDIVNTIITCADGTTISLTLDTTLPRYYSREFTVNGEKGLCVQEINAVMLEEDTDLEKYFEPNKTVRANLDNAERYKEYLPDFWRNITKEERELGHGGMDYYMMKSFFEAILNGDEMPIDVYDGASWMCITALSEASILQGGTPQAIPDFTGGKWVNRLRKDVVSFPKVKN